MSITLAEISSLLTESYDLLVELLEWQNELLDNTEVLADTADLDFLTETQVNDLLIDLRDSGYILGQPD